MTIKSALEDLSRSTLRALSGYLQKLEYLAGLRQKGEYAHWGFGKVHGQTTAARALGEAHRDAVSTVLSTPLARLLDDVQQSTKGDQQPAEEYLEGLSKKGEELLPANPGPGASRHLSSVLHALLGLVRSRERNATRRAS